MKKINWKPILIGLAIFAGIAVAGITITFIANHVGKQDELKGWAHGGHYDKKCPVHGGFPLLYNDQLPKQYNVTIALEKLNKEVNKHVKMGPIWMPWAGGTRGSQHIVGFMPAPAKEYKSGGKCHWRSDKLGWMATEWEGGVAKSVNVYICVNIVEDAFKNKGYARYWKKTNNQKLKEYWAIIQFGRENIIKHEGGHALWGTHPAWGCGLMCAKPRFGDIDGHAIEILKRHVYPVCKKNGLLNLKQ